MQARELGVVGAFVFTPEVFCDDRGVIAIPFHQSGFVAATGHEMFAVGQTIHSVSRRGVVRGVHFTDTPPGTAKYVFCPRGSVLDIVVDIRVGSPTFGRCEAVLLDQEHFRAMYLPVGVGHAFVALEDDSVVSYLLSEPFTVEHERELSVLDPRLRLPIPAGLEPIMSERDRKAPTLAELEARGGLPQYLDCLTGSSGRPAGVERASSAGS